MEQDVKLGEKRNTIWELKKNLYFMYSPVQKSEKTFPFKWMGPIVYITNRNLF